MTASLALPVLLLQIILNVVVPGSGPVLKLPEVLFTPAQPLAPLFPVQEVASFEPQRIMVLPLYERLLLSAVIKTVGFGTTCG